MTDIVSSSWYENTMSISEMSYDEYCILAFGKDVEELMEESKSFKERKENNMTQEETNV